MSEPLDVERETSRRARAARRQPRVRRALTLANTVLLTSALLLGSVEVALRVPGLRSLAALPGLRSLRAALDAPGPLAALEHSFLARLLGEEELDRLTGGTPSRAPGAPHSITGGRDGLRGGVEPTPPPAAGAPTLRGGSGGSPLAPPGDWALTITATADRTTARPGDEIVYRFIVRNVGAADFVPGEAGRWQVTAHTPPRTVAYGDVCVRALSGAIGACSPVQFPEPGLSDGQVHQVDVSSNETIRAGEAYVVEHRVQVTEAARPGTRIENHAHLDVIGDGQRAIDSNTVVVTVE